VEEERRHLEADQSAAASAREKAHQLVRDAAHQFQEAACRYQEAAVSADKAKREEERLADEQRKMAGTRRALDAAFGEAEQESRLLANARDAADRAAAIADKERRDAEAERIALAAERKEIAGEKAALANTEQRQSEQVNLLVRAADDRNGLRLEPRDEAFTMATDAMTSEERVLMSSPWTNAAIRIGRQLALALARIRQVTADLLQREDRIAAREAELDQLQSAAHERERQHALTVQDSEQRRRDQDAFNRQALLQLTERENEIERREIAASNQEVVARRGSRPSRRSLGAASIFSRASLSDNPGIGTEA